MVRTAHLSVLIASAAIACGQSPITVDAGSALASTDERAHGDWAEFPGIGLRLLGGEGVTEMGLYGNYMWSYDSGSREGLTAFGPELSLSALFTGDATYRKGTVGFRAMHLFGRVLGPCGAISFDNVSYRASLDDTRVTMHIGLTFIDLISVEYAHSTPLTSTRFLPVEDLLMVRIGLNGAVLENLLDHLSIS